ncbi:MAG: C4-dicarboxylate ABC transporter permease [Rhodospirillaceae bacterium TMED167]|nr:C4-dicarboxylate ABC transporter permease [Rhodospirillaceae bacterium]OUW30309.1 MAG: C4-dicarboxylate ABC transporter permease [Rhodospirillaceae bacterium TMED167]
MGPLFVLMFIGMPVAFAFLLVNVVGAYLFFGGIPGMLQLVIQVSESLSTFTLVPVALFLVMGEIMFHSGIGLNLLDALDKWFGSLKGRLALMAVGGGVLFSTLTGNSMGSIALLGSSLVPEMEKRGYGKPMSLGPILGSGGLAIMIPPSGLAVLLGVVAELSIGRILIAIILPGIIMAVLYTLYIVGRCVVDPKVAPPFAVEHTPISQKIKVTVTQILPVGFIIFMVVGVIFVGWATPSESAASGALATFLLATLQRRMNWTVFKNAIVGSLEISVMLLLIISGALAFTQMLAFTGATEGLVNLVLSLSTSPLIIVGIMIVTVILLGMVMSPVPIMLVTLPVFVPVVEQLGFDAIWFAVLYLIAIETGSTSPPFGAGLFVMKGVAPKGTTMGEIYRAAVPFLICDVLAILIVLFFPIIVSWPVTLMS